VKRLRLLILLRPLVLLGPLSLGQSDSQAPPELSFTISASQTWTDTGTDLTAATASASTSGLKTPTVILDSDLSKHIDGLPRRVDDHMGNLGDMVNFVIVGSEERVKTALQAADWHLADVDNKEAGLKAVLNTYQKKDYLEMPMSHLYLFDRMQDFGYEQAQAFSVVASRHHFRMWKAPFTWNGETVYVGAGTHDIGFEKDIRTGHLTHKIDPEVDLERENIGQSLEKSGKVKSMTYYLPPNPVQDAKNASGGGYHSAGQAIGGVSQLAWRMRERPVISRLMAPDARVHRR
jgi:LssY C-terminus